MTYIQHPWRLETQGRTEVIRYPSADLAADAAQEHAEATGYPVQVVEAGQLSGRWFRPSSHTRKSIARDRRALLSSSIPNPRGDYDIASGYGSAHPGNPVACTLTRSPRDGAWVLHLDTDESLDGPLGPKLRVYLNDGDAIWDGTETCAECDGSGYLVVPCSSDGTRQNYVGACLECARYGSDEEAESVFRHELDRGYDEACVLAAKHPHLFNRSKP